MEMLPSHGSPRTMAREDRMATVTACSKGGMRPANSALSTPGGLGAACASRPRQESWPSTSASASAASDGASIGHDRADGPADAIG